MASELNLHTVVTFQFMLAQSTYPALARPNNNKPNLHLIRQVLNLPLQATCSSCGKYHTFRLPLSAVSVGTNDSKWYVQHDPSITPTLEEIDSLSADQKYVHFHGIRIRTREFGKQHPQTTTDDRNSSHAHTVSPFSEIKAVLTQLRTRLNKLYLGSQAWLFPSTNCSIKVHLHNGSTGFPLTTLKKLSWITIAWQRHFDTLHAAHRITPAPLFESSLDVHLDAWLHQIKKAPGLRSLAELMTGAKAAQILDISHVQDNGPVIFSQQASTFDDNAVNAWIDVLTKVLLRALYAEGTFFAWQFSGDGEYRAPEYDQWAMLRDLHVKKNTINLYRSKTKDSISQVDEDLAVSLEATAGGDLLGPLALQVANAALANGNHSRVREFVRDKMRSGGYGRYNKAYVQAVEKYSAPKALIKKTSAESSPRSSKPPSEPPVAPSPECLAGDGDSWVVI